MTGFEPATTRPPAVYANRTAPHPVLRAANLFILCEFLKKKTKNSRYLNCSFQFLMPAKYLFLSQKDTLTSNIRAGTSTKGPMTPTKA